VLPTWLIFSAKFGARIVKIDGSAIAVASLCAESMAVPRRTTCAGM
jgi:hypothetical protein